MMRKSISVNEAKSRAAKQLDFSEKLLKELNTKASNKLRLVRADIDMGDADEAKLIGTLDTFNMALENAINTLAKV
jgi:hypothetical protein